MAGSRPNASNAGSAALHESAIGHAARVRMTRPSEVTRPSSEYRSAPNACPPSVEHALAMPTITLLPVTFPSVVASAAPRRKGPEVAHEGDGREAHDAVAYHAQAHRQGEPELRDALAEKAPSAADASAFSARDSGARRRRRARKRPPRRRGPPARTPRGSATIRTSRDPGNPRRLPPSPRAAEVW